MHFLLIEDIVYCDGKSLKLETGTFKDSKLKTYLNSA